MRRSDSPLSTPWFVCPRPNPGASTRVLFFPHAGGGPTLFYRWIAELPRHLEGWAAHYPGRGSRHHEPALNDMVTLVDELSREIVPLLDRPFVFFGHSMGGIVAFELTRHLCQNNISQPATLFVSGCAAPHLPGPQPAVHELPDKEFIDVLQELNGIPAELLQLPDAMELFLPSLRADFAMIENYRYVSSGSALDCRISAFGGLDDTRTSADQLEGWAVHTKSGFRSHYFPGDHLFLNSARESILACIAAEIANSSPHAR